MIHRSIRRAAPLAALFPALLSAEIVNITGKLTDASGKPMVLAQAALKHAGLSALTDENGIYTISGTTGIADPVRKKETLSPQMAGSLLRFTIPESRSVRIEIFSLSGRKIDQIHHENLAAGTYSISPFESLNIGSGVYLVRYSDGVRSAVLKSAWSKTRGSSDVSPVSTQISAEPKAALRADAPDTLIVKSREGSEITAVPLKSLIETVPTMFVVQRNIEGNFTGQALRGTGMITAVLTEEGSEPKTMKLGYNEANSSYSGFVYSLYSKELKHYSVQVNHFAKDSLISGRSVVVPYTSELGDITVPAFNPNNLMPIVQSDYAGFAASADTLKYPLSVKVSGAAADQVSGEIEIKWGINQNVLKTDTVKFSGTLEWKDTVRWVPASTSEWLNSDNIMIKVTPLLREPFLSKGVFMQTDAPAGTLAAPSAVVKLTADKDSLRGSYTFTHPDPLVKEGASKIKWYKNGTLIDSGKSVIALPAGLLLSDSISFEVTPAAINGFNRIGKPSAKKITNIGRVQILTEFLTAPNSYNKDYRYAFADTLGARGGVYSGGLFDSWGTETQCQIALPKTPFTLSNTSVNYSADNAHFYWMGLALAQEIMGYDLQLLAAMGAKETSSGLGSKGNLSSAGGAYGPFHIELSTGPDRALNYPSLYPAYETVLQSARDVPSSGINQKQFMETYNGVSEGNLSSAITISSIVQYVQNLSILYEVMEHSSKLHWKDALMSSKEYRLGLSAILPMYNLGMWGIMPTMADLFSPTKWQSTSSNTASYLLFPEGNSNYRSEIFTAAGALETASKQAKANLDMAIMDFPISKTELNELFFGTGGSVSKQGTGGLLQHWHYGAADPVRQQIYDQINLCFDSMKGKAPSVKDTESISFRYDLLFIIRSVKEQLPFNPPVPTKGDAGSLIIQNSK